MTSLLELKQHLKLFYSKFDTYIIPVLKFLLALAVFFTINGQIGFMERAAGPAVSLLLALLCAFLPVNLIALFGALLICLHAFALSIEVFAMAAGLLFIMYALYFRVAPGYGYVLVITPLAFFSEYSVCDSAGDGPFGRSGMRGAGGMRNGDLLSDFLYEE